MTGLLTRLAARAKGLSTPPDSTVRSSLRPQLPGRFETSVKPSFDVVNVENIAVPFVPSTDEKQKDEKSTYQPKEAKFDNSYTHSASILNIQNSPKVEQPLPLQPKDRTLPEPELTTNTPSIAVTKKDTGPAPKTRKNKLSSIDRKSSPRQKTRFPDDSKTDHRTIDLPKRQSETPLVPIKLQAQTPSENPLVSPHSLAEVTARSNGAPMAAPAPPDVVIQIDRIDIQVEKPAQKPLRKSVKKPELTDLSSYLTGQRDRR